MERKKVWCSYKAIWKSWHKHRHCKNFTFNFMFLKFTPQYSLLCLVIQHQHHFATITYSLQFPLHPFRGIHWCSRKKFALFLRDTCQLIYGKELRREFISKTSIEESFLSKLTVFHRSFSQSYLQQLFCIEPFNAYFCKKETPLQTLFQENKEVWRLYSFWL